MPPLPPTAINLRKRSFIKVQHTFEGVGGENATLTEKRGSEICIKMEHRICMLPSPSQPLVADHRQISVCSFDSLHALFTGPHFQFAILVNLPSTVASVPLFSISVTNWQDDREEEEDPSEGHSQDWDTLEQAGNGEVLTS